MEINETFKNYFKELYINNVDHLDNDFTEFFSAINLPILSLEDIKTLDSPITLSDLWKAVQNTNKGCTPGLDRIAVELYLVLWDILGPIWLDTLNYAIENGAFHRDLNMLTMFYQSPIRSP